MSHCGNCANYNIERMCHTDICRECFVEGLNGYSGKPSKWKPLPLTNGDRIRAMTDEELAWNLIFRRDYWIDWETPVGCYSDQVEAHRKTVAWLKQPVEEET